jgi:hypothetical protein
MIHSVDPRQNRLFDPFQGVIPPAGIKIIASGWQGVFRHIILEVMPVSQLAQHFSDSLGAPTKELYSMAGLVFLADFFDWNAQDAIEAYIFRSDVQYALNLEPGATLSTRTLERYQQLFREDDLAAKVFDKVTAKLIDALDLDVSRQRLDSTHVFSHMATFGRTKSLARNKCLTSEFSGRWCNSTPRGMRPSADGSRPSPSLRSWFPKDKHSGRVRM